MSLTCAKCKSRINEKALDGSIRSACPICQSPLTEPSFAASLWQRTSVPPPSSKAHSAASNDSGQPSVSTRNMKYGEELAQTVPPWAVLGLIALFTFMGIFFAVVGYVRRAESDASASWPSVQGVITSSELREVRNKPRRLPYEIVKYTVDVTYTYAVNGNAYSGNRLVLNDNLWDEGSARNRLSKYAVGSTHFVYYSPNDPERAVLEPGETYEGDTAGEVTLLGVWLPLGMILIVLLLGVIYALMKRDLPAKA